MFSVGCKYITNKVSVITMKKIMLPFIASLFFACKVKNHEHNPQKINIKSINAVIETSDTLRNPYSYYYLADINPKQFAKLILSDSIIPSDNYSTFRIIDSIEAVSFEDRKCFFSAFQHIMKKADGALAEVIGDPARFYTLNHTKEFLNFTNDFSSKDIELFANYVAYEFTVEVVEEDIKTRTQNYFNQFKSNCKDCSPQEKEKLGKFCEIVNQSIENNK